MQDEKSDRIYTTGLDDAGRRIDVVLRRLFPGIPLGRIYRALRSGEVRVGGRRVAQSFRVSESVEISVPSAFEPASGKGTGDAYRSAGESRSRHAGERSTWQRSAGKRRAAQQHAGGQGAGARSTGKRRSTGGIAYDVRSMVLYRDSDIIALNKPRGMLVQGADVRRPRSAQGPTDVPLDDAVRELLRDDSRASRPSLSFRPGPSNRLDRNTSGVVLFSASLAGAHLLSSMVRERHLLKYYLAVLGGDVKTEPESTYAVWDDVLERDERSRVTSVRQPDRAPALSDTGASGRTPSNRGRRAVTFVRPLAVGGPPAVTLCLVKIETGRTHQIRAQAAAHGHPLAGDAKYGGRRPTVHGARPLGAGTGGENGTRAGSFYLHAVCVASETAVPAIWAPVPEDWTDGLRSLFGAKRLREALSVHRLEIEARSFP